MERCSTHSFATLHELREPTRKARCSRKWLLYSHLGKTIRSARMLGITSLGSRARNKSNQKKRRFHSTCMVAQLPHLARERRRNIWVISTTLTCWLVSGESSSSSIVPKVEINTAWHELVTKFTSMEVKDSTMLSSTICGGLTLRTYSGWSRSSLTLWD